MIKALEIHSRIYELLLNLYPKLTSKKMRNDKKLSTDIKNEFLDYLSNINKSSRVRSMRKSFAEDAERNLENISTYIEVLGDMSYISEAYQNQICNQLTITKKQLTAYIRTS